ncbi:MAG: Histidine biosynthesis bifunctional protein HisB [Candidatus Ordinivivax streblomastigis]|uniref:Histidine biosynthesis bifunctional protein HisB n=1 Tax=Candidatus Ordinivivax streblomastigis TaxID=2540710 RepID=A0A5M8P3I5_9BACT|nr:MAG: Histidine biosynthesis bifunctional protein HisB [Candidatus Ordinivivax streblomastigis]
MQKKVLFIDRDGTLIAEPPVTFQVNNLEQLEFLPGVIRNLYRIRQKLDFELVMVTNQDGLGTPVYPQENFDCVQNKMLSVFKNEGITFDALLIDKSFPEDHLPTRKPGTALLTAYLSGDYDLENSFVIGDRTSDVELAKNLGCKALFINPEKAASSQSLSEDLGVYLVSDWDEISKFLFAKERTAIVQRQTKETDIYVSLDLDGQGKAEISTGLGFFDHLLEQIAKHSSANLVIKVKGDLHVDEHHTIEDTGIALGEAFLQALSDKRGIERYGFCLPMDDCLCRVALDFGGRPWLVWDVDFHRERVGDMPTEMFLHFFKSLSDAAKMNLNIRAEGQNEHHKIEGIFKAFARAVKMAVRRDVFCDEIPTTKGVL